MLGAFWFRYARVLRRSAADSASMFVRPLVSGCLFAVFASAVGGGGSSTSFLVASVAIFNVVTNTVIAAAYESRLDADGGRLGLIVTAPRGLGGYLVVQAGVQLAIALLQSAVVVVCFIGTFDFGGVTASWGVSVACLVFLVLGLAVLGARQAALKGSFVGTSFTISMLMVFAGAFYPVDQLPQWAELLSRANPLTYLVDQIRAPLVGGSAIPVGAWAIALVAGSCAVLLVAVLLAVRRNADLSAATAQI